MRHVLWSRNAYLPFWNKPDKRFVKTSYFETCSQKALIAMVKFIFGIGNFMLFFHRVTRKKFCLKTSLWTDIFHADCFEDVTNT